VEYGKQDARAPFAIVLFDHKLLPVVKVNFDTSGALLAYVCGYNAANVGMAGFNPFGLYVNHN